eukprot:233909-Rhodomonas_salina.2
MVAGVTADGKATGNAVTNSSGVSSATEPPPPEVNEKDKPVQTSAPAVSEPAPQLPPATKETPVAAGKEPTAATGQEQVVAEKSVTPPAPALRDKHVENAVKFLQHPKVKVCYHTRISHSTLPFRAHLPLNPNHMLSSTVCAAATLHSQLTRRAQAQSATMAQRKAFLEKKGTTAAEVDAAIAFLRKQQQQNPAASSTPSSDSSSSAHAPASSLSASTAQPGAAGGGAAAASSPTQDQEEGGALPRARGANNHKRAPLPP